MISNHVQKGQRFAPELYNIHWELYLSIQISFLSAIVYQLETMPAAHVHIR